MLSYMNLQFLLDSVNYFGSIAKLKINRRNFGV